MKPLYITYLNTIFSIYIMNTEIPYLKTGLGRELVTQHLKFKTDSEGGKMHYIIFKAFHYF